MTATNAVKFEVGLNWFGSLTARREKGRDCWEITDWEMEVGSEEGDNPEITVKGEMRRGVGRGFGIYLIRPSEISEEKRKNDWPCSGILTRVY